MLTYRLAQKINMTLFVFICKFISILFSGTVVGAGVIGIFFGKTEAEFKLAVVCVALGIINLVAVIGDSNLL